MIKEKNPVISEIDGVWINNWAKENKYGLINNGNNPKIVVVGENHHDRNFIKQQERLISKLKPEYLLLESIGMKTYDPLTNKESIPKNRRFGGKGTFELDIGEKEIQWSKKYGAFLIGCDLSDGEISDLGKILAQKFPERYVWDSEYDATSILNDEPPYFSAQDEKAVQYRDEKMGEIMVEYVEKATKPLVTIVGAHHMRSESPMHQILKNSNIEYLAVDQTYGEKNNKK